MSRRIARLAVASLAVLIGWAPVAAQEPTPYYEWSPARTDRASESQRVPGGPASDGEAIPQASAEAPAPAASDPATLGRGRWSFAVLLGADGLGAGVALQGALGLGTVGPVRVDLLADVQRTGGRLDGGGGDLSIARGALLLALSIRSGAIEPWVAAGVGRAAAESTSPSTVSGCLPVIGCWAYDTEEMLDADAGGPVLAGGVRLAVTRRLLVGIEMRKALIPEVRLGGATPVALDRLFVGGGLTWRGGPAVGAR